MACAGHETTTQAVSWALHLLSRHPDVQSSLRAEVVGVCGCELQMNG